MNPVNFKEQFWAFVLEISQKHEINNYYIVEERNDISYHDDEGVCHLVEFDAKRTIMYMNMNFGYQEFKKYLHTYGLPICSSLYIKDFLKTVFSFLGIIKAKRIHGRTSRCYIIDITGIDTLKDRVVNKPITNYPISMQKLDVIFDTHADCHIMDEKAISRKEFINVITKYFNHK